MTYDNNVYVYIYIYVFRLLLLFKYIFIRLEVKNMVALSFKIFPTLCFSFQTRDVIYGIVGYVDVDLK